MNRKRRAGFSLVEVAIALGIAAFCLVALLGLLPLGLNSTRAASEETLAMNIATAVIADLKSVPNLSGTSSSSPQVSKLYQLSLPLPGASSVPTPFLVTETGKITTAANNDARYLVTMTMTAPPNNLSVSNQLQPTLVNIRISWPAQASLQNASGSIETFTALDRW